MKVRQLLILNGNKEERLEMVNYFQDTHYDVESSPSAAYSIAKIIQGHNPLVIMSDTFEEKISASDVIALMKRVNKDLKIVLISDNSSLETLKKIHEDGILYHSLKLRDDGDVSSLLDVVYHSI